MHEKQVGYGRRGSGLSGPVRPFVSVLSRLASGLVVSCPVFACIFLPWFLCSCLLSSLMRLLCACFSLLRCCLRYRCFLLAFCFCALRGGSVRYRCLLFACFRGSPGLLLGLPWAASGPLLSLVGRPGRLLGSLLAALGPLLARPWAAPGLS